MDNEASRAVVESFWRAMQSNDWARAARHLSPECWVDWPCTGEQIVGRDNFVALQARYPSSGAGWAFDIHRLIADGPTVVSEVTTSDGEQTARVVAFSEVVDGLIAHQVEYWPTFYEPPNDRSDLTRPGPRLP